VNSVPEITSAQSFFLGARPPGAYEYDKEFLGAEVMKLAESLRKFPQRSLSSGEQGLTSQSEGELSKRAGRPFEADQTCDVQYLRWENMTNTFNILPNIDISTFFCKRSFFCAFLIALSAPSAPPAPPYQPAPSAPRSHSAPPRSPSVGGVDNPQRQQRLSTPPGAAHLHTLNKKRHVGAARDEIVNVSLVCLGQSALLTVTGRIDTGRAVRNREYQLDETKLGKEQIVNLSITYCRTIVN
jgi:hypothetical protein